MNRVISEYTGTREPAAVTNADAMLRTLGEIRDLPETGPGVDDLGEGGDE